MWHAGADSLTVGYKLLAQPEAVFECPPTFRNQVGLCEAGEPALLSASAFRDTPTIETMFQQRLAHFAVDGRVYLSPATFEYVEHAAAWWQNMTDMHMAAGVVVVAMDAGTFTYLDHRNISVALLETVLPLQPCCLARLHMVAWRATNDVKARAPLCFVLPSNSRCHII